jgi:hypothetical protein
MEHGKEVVKDKGHEVRVGKTVAFNVGVGKGTAALTHMSGLAVKFFLTWHDFNAISYVSTGPGQGNLTLDVKGLPDQHLTCGPEGCK